MNKYTILRNTFWLVLAFSTVSAQAASLVLPPVRLDPGSNVNQLPNGYSSGDGVTATGLLDRTLAFSYSNGPAGNLRVRVVDYADRPSINHPGLYFDYEIQLTSGSVTSFSIAGYVGFETFVKVCGINLCRGSGANGIAATDARRSSDGDQITFNFGAPLTAGQYSANLQIFASASSFSDSLAYLIDNSGNSFSIDVVAPAAVPQPATSMMMLLGFAGLGFFAFNRKRLQW